MSPEKLIYMANQIGGFFLGADRAQAAERVAAHINDFWDPRMRAALLEIGAKGGAGLDPTVVAALAHVRAPA